MSKKDADVYLPDQHWAEVIATIPPALAADETLMRDVRAKLEAAINEYLSVDRMLAEGSVASELAKHRAAIEDAINFAESWEEDESLLVVGECLKMALQALDDDARANLFSNFLARQKRLQKKMRTRNFRGFIKKFSASGQICSARSLLNITTASRSGTSYASSDRSSPSASTALAQ